MVQLSTHQWIFRVAVLMTALCSCTIGLADALNVFTSEADFLAAAPVVSTETFEEFTRFTTFRTPQIMIGDVVYTTDECDLEAMGSCWIIEGSPTLDTGNALVANSIGSTEMSFGPGQFALAIGFLLSLPGHSPGGTFLGWQIVVNERNGQSSVIDVPPISFPTDFYFGFLSDVGISKVTVQDNPGDGEANNWALDNVSHSVITSLVDVDIDIKPGSDPNCFNNNTRGVIPVVILSSADFNATQVDPSTVQLAGLAVKIAGKSNKYLAHTEDVNGDGLIDLVVQIEDTDQVFTTGTTTATLTGNLYDGTPIEGEDDICIVP